MKGVIIIDDEAMMCVLNSDGTTTPIVIQDATLSISDISGLEDSPSALAQSYDNLKRSISIPIKGEINPKWLKFKTIRTPTATYRELPWPWRLDASS